MNDKEKEFNDMVQNALVFAFENEINSGFLAGILNLHACMITLETFQDKKEAQKVFVELVGINWKAALKNDDDIKRIHDDIL